MRIVFAAKGQRGLACLDAILASRHEVKLIVLPVTGSEEIEQLATASRIPVLRPDDINAPSTVSETAKINADIMVLAGYTQILRDPMLSQGAPAFINLHGGKLPQYRGGSPINWQIINGETEGGCAVCYVDEGIDTGDIIFQETYPINADEGAAEAIAKTLKIFPRLVVQALDGLANQTAPRKKQDLSKASYFHKRHPEDGRIHWSEMDAIDIHNLVRALRGPDLPGAFCFLGDEKLIVHRTSLLTENLSGDPGRIEHDRNGTAVVFAKDRGLMVTEVRRGGGRPETKANGILSPGQVLS